MGSRRSRRASRTATARAGLPWRCWRSPEYTASFRTWAAQRTQEIGIRIAIGASPSQVIWLVTNQGLRAAAAGLAAGTAGYLLISRLLAGQLFGVSVTDPLTLLGTAVGLVLVCPAASAIPALRAVRIDPRALQHNG